MIRAPFSPRWAWNRGWIVGLFMLVAVVSAGRTPTARADAGPVAAGPFAAGPFAAGPFAAGPFAAGLPSAVFDQNSVGWLSVRNMTSSQFSAYFDEKARDGYMVIDIEVDEIDGTQRVGAVWQKNTDGRGWVERRNLTSDEFHALWDELRLKGYRVIDQDAYSLDGRLLWAGVWIQNTEGLDWASRRNLSSEQFAAEFDEYSNRGFIMVDVEAYSTDTGVLYAAVWVQNAENLDWVEWRNLNDDEFRKTFELYRDRYRMLDVESYRVGGTQYYAGIWIENVHGRGWYEYRDMTAKTYGDRWLRLRDAGYRVIDFEAYETGDGWRYAGIWRQNSERPNWSLREEVDALVEEEYDDFDLPGIGVAIAENGVFRYLRGVGYADIDDEVIAHSRTVYRLASVSKAVAGVLGVRMQQLGQIDLNQPTSTYIPGLPAFHTHSVSQTLSMRSGIGHYSTYPDIEDEYATAFDAVQELEDTPLAFAPGTCSGATYSTHAYTFTAAGYEGATGPPIDTIIANRLTDPFALNSLRPEDLTVPDKYRATIYDTDNDEVAPDNLDWKRLGGGLESSPYDLARLVMKVLNGSILSADSRDVLWTAPDGVCSWALGWRTGTESGEPWVDKNGIQLGSRTYVRVYPDLGIAIVVLINRRDGGQNPDAVGQAIGSLMLAAAQQRVATSGEPPAALADQSDLDEPAEEGLDPAQIVMPQIRNPVIPTEADKVEVNDTPPVFVPVVVR
jgi:CubicO group peptidase (beta-lactamase class C family)